MPGSLDLSPRIADPDDFYDHLIELHRGLSPEQSQKVNAKLILLLSNHIGDRSILEAAIAKAKEGIA